VTRRVRENQWHTEEEMWWELLHITYYSILRLNINVLNFPIMRKIGELVESGRPDDLLFTRNPFH
jgi:hypothetical protein